MPSVETWYQMPEDEVELFAHLASTGDCVFVAGNRPSSPEAVVIRPINEFLGMHAETDCAIGLRDRILSQGIQAYGKPDAVKAYGLPGSAECIHYSRTLLEGSALYAANLVIYASYYSDDYSEMISQPADFLRWANSVMRWVRRRANSKVTVNGFDYRATPRAAEAVLSKRVKVEV